MIVFLEWCEEHADDDDSGTESWFLRCWEEIALPLCVENEHWGTLGEAAAVTHHRPRSSMAFQLFNEEVLRDGEDSPYEQDSP